MSKSYYLEAFWKWYTSRRLYRVGGSLLWALPITFLALALLNEPFPNVEPFDRLRQFITDQWGVLLVCAAWPILSCVRPFLREHCDDLLERNATPCQQELVSLMQLIDRVVAKKLTRFSREAGRAIIPRKRTKLVDHLQSLTKPSDQIDRILIALAQFLQLNFEIDTRVSLAALDDKGLFEEWVQWLPEDDQPRRIREDLRYPDCAMTKAANDAKSGGTGVVIIESINSEVKKPASDRRFHPEDGPGLSSNDKGSLICCAVYNPELRQVPYVICISTQEDGAFKNKQHDYWCFVLHFFSKRILLEYALELILKHKAKN
jgi:hypothetical protein